MLNRSSTNTDIEPSQEVNVDMGYLSDMKPFIIFTIIIMNVIVNTRYLSDREVSATARTSRDTSCSHSHSPIS